MNNLNKGRKRKYFSIKPQFEKISFFHRYPVSCFKPLFSESQMIEGSLPNIRLSPPIGKDILIIAVHLPSKLHRKDETQAFNVRQLMKEIRFYEAKLSHTRTVIVGDMNMNPFEDGITSADCFHSVMDKRIAQEKDRNVSKTKCSYFYNPMWRLMGDSIQGPPGTYFYRSGESVVFFWNTFDQVLVRPSLIGYYKEESLRIIDSINGVTLLNERGRPDGIKHSDHLPLFFEIDIERIEEDDNNGKDEPLVRSERYT